MERTELHVDGMSCGHCEIAVQDAVRKLARHYESQSQQTQKRNRG